MNTEEEIIVNQENTNEEFAESQEANEESGRLESLAAEIVSEMKAAGELSIQVRLKARRAGELLCEAKKLIKHGEWEAWLLKNRELPKRRAQ